MVLKLRLVDHFQIFFFNKYSYFFKKKQTKPNLNFIYGNKNNNLNIQDYDISLPSNIRINKNNIYYTSKSNFSFLINLFESLVNMKKKLLIHGIAYNKKKTVFIAGPDDTGKTSLAIKLSSKGSEVFSEDWSCVDINGNVYPWPRKCHLFDYNFIQSHEILKNKIKYSFTVKKIKSQIKDLIKSRLSFLQKVYNYFVHLQYYTYSFEDLGGKTAHNKKIIDKFYWFQKKNINKIKINKISKKALIDRITGHYLYERSSYFRISSRLYSLGNTDNIIVKYLLDNNEYKARLEKFLSNFKNIREIQIPKKMSAKKVSEYIYNTI